MRRAAQTCGLVLWLGCGGGAANEERPPQPLAPAPSAELAAAASEPVQNTPSESRELRAVQAALGGDAKQTLPERVRAADWQGASEALAALPEAERAQPALRFLAAKLAYERNDAAQALQLLAPLEAELPAIAERVRVLLALAAAKAERSDAGQLLEQLGADYTLQASRAFAKAGQSDGVRRTTKRLIPHKRKAIEAEARQLRMQLGDERQLLSDARWLATHGAATEFGEAGLRALRERKQKLSVSELQKRAQTLADAGQPDALRAVAATLEHAKVADAKQHRAELCALRARALFQSRKHYGEAERMHLHCEKQAKLPEAKAEHAFLAARAALRANRDDEAIPLFERMLDRYPSSARAHEARALIARTHFLLGHFAKAHEQYERHQAQLARGAMAEEAAHYRPFAALYGGKASVARRLFEERTSLVRAQQGKFAELFSALSLLKQGDKTLAMARLRELVRKAPLSTPGWLARQHLAELGEIAPVPFEDAAEVSAAPLPLRLPDGVALLHALGLDDDAEAMLSARERMVTAQAHGRETEALCASYNLLGRTRRSYRMSARLPAAKLEQAPLGPALWVWQCSYPRPYLPLVRAAAAAHNVPETLLHAIMRTESGFDADALSRVGAQGLMQLMPATAARLDPQANAKDPAHNIALGAKHLAEIQQLTGSWPLAAAGYNGSPEAVLRWRKRLPSLPMSAFLATIPLSETRAYVSRVIEVWARYQLLLAPQQTPQLDLQLP